MSFDLNAVAGLLHVVKETLGHPSLKPLHDNAMRQLQEHAAALAEEEAKLKDAKAKEARDKETQEALDRTAEVDRVAAENLAKADEERELQRKAEAKALADKTVKPVGDPKVLAQHPKVVDGVIVGDDEIVKDEEEVVQEEQAPEYTSQESGQPTNPGAASQNPKRRL